MASADYILLDIRLKDGDGLDMLEEIRRGGHRDVPVIVATAYGDSERTIRAMRDGAFDYLTKPFDLPVLLATVERAVKQRALVRNLASADAVAASLPPAQEKERPGTLVGTSASMLAIWKLIGRAAASSAPVLITGETGVGKELVARAIHSYSPREPRSVRGGEPGRAPGHAARERALWSLSAAPSPGRPDDAPVASNRPAAAPSSSTRSAISTARCRPKLLRVLSDGSFERVGGSEMLVSKARIVSATHKKVRAGEPGSVLREDLYYRLCTIEIEVPPLARAAQRHPAPGGARAPRHPARAVSEEAMALLYNYSWPGNVRELVHVLERARGAGRRRGDRCGQSPRRAQATGRHARPHQRDTRRRRRTAADAQGGDQRAGTDG